MPSPPPPLRRDQDIVAAAEDAAESRTLAPASTYRRREPAFANVEVLAASDRAALELRWRQPEEAAPAIHLHRIGPCRVTFPGVVRLADGRVVAESLHNLPEPRRQAMRSAGSYDVRNCVSWRSILRDFSRRQLRGTRRRQSS